MTKFSDFIRAPGTAGPPTQEGISALGFVLNTEVPGILGKYVRVDAAQSFTGGEEAQGRANLDAQQFSASLTSLAGLTTAADRLAYTTAPNTWAVTTLTAFGRSLLDDADATAARTTIGLGNVDNTSDLSKPISTATQTALNLKAPLASPTFTGVPAVPTAAPGTNTTQAASTAFVIANAALDTRTWQDVSGSRAPLTSYQNTTGRTIEIACSIGEASATDSGVRVSPNGSTGWVQLFTNSSTTTGANYNFSVPAGWYYEVNRPTGTGALTVITWAEFR